MSLGFEQAGVTVAAAIDNDPIHVLTHKKNFPHSKTLQANLSNATGVDIRKITGIGESQIDILFGGPPCQGFSIGGVREAKDPRNQLLFDFARLIGELNPSYFVVENVGGLLLSYARPFLEGFASRVEAAGYGIVDIQALNAVDFGVPQRRKRTIILGYKTGLCPPYYPVPELIGSNSLPTVWDAIGDLAVIDCRKEFLKNGVFTGDLGEASWYGRILRGEEVDPHDRSWKRRLRENLANCSETIHKPEIIERFRGTMPGNSDPVSRFYRLLKEGIAPTLRAGTDFTRGSYTASRPIHPEHPRCITVREAARLHSFPDWFVFNNTVWHGYRQVGNAVPPLFARAMANSVVSAWMKTNEQN